MTLVTRASFRGQSELQSGKKIMKLKKDVWINEDDIETHIDTEEIEE